MMKVSSVSASVAECLVQSWRRRGSKGGKIANCHRPAASFRTLHILVVEIMAPKLSVVEWWDLASRYGIFQRVRV